MGGVESPSGNVSELTILTATPSSSPAVESTLRMRPAAPPALAALVVPLMRKRSSARMTALPPPVPHVEIFLWPRMPLRQSWRCSKRSVPCGSGGVFAKVMWSCGLMRPGEMTASAHVTCVAPAYVAMYFARRPRTRASSCSSPRRTAMLPFSSMRTSPSSGSVGVSSRPRTSTLAVVPTFEMPQLPCGPIGAAFGRRRRRCPGA